MGKTLGQMLYEAEGCDPQFWQYEPLRFKEAQELTAARFVAAMEEEAWRPMSEWQMQEHPQGIMRWHERGWVVVQPSVYKDHDKYPWMTMDGKLTYSEDAFAPFFRALPAPPKGVRNG